MPTIFLNGLEVKYLARHERTIKSNFYSVKSYTFYFTLFMMTLGHTATFSDLTFLGKTVTLIDSGHQCLNIIPKPVDKKDLCEKYLKLNQCFHIGENKRIDCTNLESMKDPGLKDIVTGCDELVSWQALKQGASGLLKGLKAFPENLKQDFIDIKDFLDGVEFEV